MLRADEIERGLKAAWRLARRDPGGMGQFDTSIEGFWRSFHAAVVAAPIYALLIVCRQDEAPRAAGWDVVLLVEAIAYVIHWTAMPVIMVHVTRWLDRQPEYVSYVVAINWANVIQLGLFAVPAVLGAIGLPRVLAGLLTVIVTVWVLVYQWYIARTALKLTGPPAAGIVALDMVIGLVVHSIAREIES